MQLLLHLLHLRATSASNAALSCKRSLKGATQEVDFRFRFFFGSAAHSGLLELDASERSVTAGKLLSLGWSASESLRSVILLPFAIRHGGELPRTVLRYMQKTSFLGILHAHEKELKHNVFEFHSCLLSRSKNHLLKNEQAFVKVIFFRNQKSPRPEPLNQRSSYPNTNHTLLN